MTRKSSRPKMRRSSMFAIMLLIVLTIAMGYVLHQMNTQLDLARAEQAVYAQRLANLQDTNARLADDIAHSDDPERIEEIARNDLGMASEGEKIFRFQN